MPNKPESNWSLSEWLDFLENRHLNEVQLRLVNPKIVAERMNLIDWQIPVITVAGTNGKGSTVQALEAIYCAAGYRVGCFTSPHLLRFNERIRVNKKWISDASLCTAFMMIEAARANTPLTYFETVFLASLLYFKESALDVIILEVGVGGRLDATNIIDADISVITTVDLDHQDYLGNDKEQIGFEKAGIMRANTRSIYADESPPASVVKHAHELGVNLYHLGVDYSFTEIQNQLCIERQDAPPIVVVAPKLNLKAAVAAILATDYLSNILPVNQSHWDLSMQNIQIMGRQQLTEGEVNVLYDVAHNPQAVTLLANFIREYNPKGLVHAVFSGLKDKDLNGLIRPMLSIVDRWYPAVLNSKRASDASLLATIFQTEAGFVPVCFPDPVAAFHTAMQMAKSGDLVVVFGSFLLVGAVMEEVLNETSPI